MSWFDICILMIITAASLYGFLKGILSEIFAVAAIVIGFFVAFRFSVIVQPYFLPYIRRETSAQLICFVGLFFVTALSIVLIGVFLKKVLRVAHLSWLDRMVGGIIGIAKGILVSIFISLMIAVCIPGGKRFIRKSPLARRALSAARIVLYVLPVTTQRSVVR